MAGRSIATRTTAAAAFVAIVALSPTDAHAAAAKPSAALVAACQQVAGYVAGEPAATTSARLKAAGAKFLAGAPKDASLRASFAAMSDADAAFTAQNIAAVTVAVTPVLATCLKKAKIDARPQWAAVRLPDAPASTTPASVPTTAVVTTPPTAAPTTAAPGGIDPRNSASNTNLASENNGLPWGFAMPKQAGSIKVDDLPPDSHAYEIVGDDQLGPLTDYLEGQCGSVGWPKAGRLEPSRQTSNGFTGWTSALVCRAPDTVGGTTWGIEFDVVAVEGEKALVIFTTMKRYTPKL